MTPLLPVCFVLMPFGRKPDGVGGTVDFDAVYRDAIRPAIADAGLEPLRADEEMAGGIIHKPMFERLVLCPFAVADLTTANANVFYELGVRHAVKPWSTALLFAEGARLPFDVGLLRALPYRLTPDGQPADAAQLRANLSAQLRQAVASHADAPSTDSPLFQLLDGYPNIAHDRTDIFRAAVEYSRVTRERLASARSAGVEAVRDVEHALGDLTHQEAGVLIDLFLSYRAVSAWNDMIHLVARMSRELASTVLVQEQYALALNRAKRRDDAERVILALLERRGASSETYGILGRIYKDQWDDARATNVDFVTRGILDKAIAAYLRGFESDWRDAYPGINAITLMDLRNPPDARRHALAPIVQYAVDRRMEFGKGDYWDYATCVELAVLTKNEEQAFANAASALALVTEERWTDETTARNLGLIRQARVTRGEALPWANEIEEQFLQRASTPRN